MTVGSQYRPGLRQRITVQNGPSEPGGDERILLTGYRASTAPADFDLAPERMVSADDAIALYEEGSQLALMVRSAFLVGPLARLDQRRGQLPQIWAMAMAPPVGTAAEFTLTWTGPATANAEIPIEVANERAILQVLTDDTADDIAAKAELVIQGLQRNLPVTAASALAVTTLAARDQGAHTNELFLYADVRKAPGVGVTVARSIAGVGVVDMTPVFAATTGADWAVVVLPQQDTLTRDAIKPHVQAMWDEDTGLRRRVIMPHGGLLTVAATDAQAIDDYRAIVASAERRPGIGTEWDPRHSARSSSTECAAALAARLESQRRPNWNFNNATLPVRGRPEKTLTGAEYDVARNAGVSVILDAEGNAPGVIADPITTATKDQTGVTVLTNRTFLPAEFARVIRAVAAQHAIKDAGFTQAASVSDEQTRQDIKAAGLSVLSEAARLGWIRTVSDADVTVVFLSVSGAEVSERSEQYAVIVGLDDILIHHIVTRA